MAVSMMEFSRLAWVAESKEMQPMVFVFFDRTSHMQSRHVDQWFSIQDLVPAQSELSIRHKWSSIL